jgi:hypothetical protein
VNAPIENEAPEAMDRVLTVNGIESHGWISAYSGIIGARFDVGVKMVKSMFQSGNAGAYFTTKQSKGKTLIVLSLHWDQTTIVDREPSQSLDKKLNAGYYWC